MNDIVLKEGGGFRLSFSYGKYYVYNQDLKHTEGEFENLAEACYMFNDCVQFWSALMEDLEYYKASMREEQLRQEDIKEMLALDDSGPVDDSEIN